MIAIAPEHRVVLIRISRSAPEDGDPMALYDATRQWWRIAEARTGGGPSAPQHALAVVGGTVVAAYDIEGWARRHDGRRGFTGRPAGGPVADYVGADVRRYFPRGAANPVRFVHCEDAGLAPGGAADLSGLASAPIRSLAEEISTLVTEIDREPLAHIMFGHRELFHSNLLAWFFESLPEAADQVFTRGLPRGEQVEREVSGERQHLDLVITVPGRERLVIENKVFSVYDLEQLDAYAEVTAAWAASGGGPSHHVLLSMLDPAWPNGTHASPDGLWHHLGYDDLAARLEHALAGAGDGYAVETVRHYARLVRLLHRLTRAVGVRSLDETVALPPATVVSLGAKQLAGAMVKLRARHTAQLVGTALAEAGVGGDVSSGFTRGEPIVDWYADVVDEAGQDVVVGWQLQHGTFRRCLVLDHLSGKGTARVEARFHYAASHPEWFDFSPVDGALGTEDTPVAPPPTPSKPHGFNKYDPDFVYRSKKVPGMTVRQLIDAAVAVARDVGATA